MPIPQHTIHIYQRPAQGSSFLKRYPVYNYQHSIVNQGWFDTASCDIAVRSQNEGSDILNNYLGAFVAVYVDNPLVPIWEGLINRIILNSGGASYTISLDEMANRVSVMFTGVANAGTQSVIANNTVSQGIYGIKQDQIEFGADPTTPATPQRITLRNVILAQRAFPQTAVTQGQGQSNTVHFELIGIFHTLEWEKLFTAGATTTTAYTTAIQNEIGAIANGTTFFNNADTTQITTNGSGGSSPDQQRGMSVWDRILKIAEAGDSANYWVCGVLPTDANLGTRRFYYRIQNGTTEYTALQKDGLKPRNLYGKPIPPWLVVPDKVIRVQDTLVGFGSNLITDPRATYIQSIQYDANSQSVQWFGTDDTTARGAFLMKRAFKPVRNMVNAAPLRVIVT